MQRLLNTIISASFFPSEVNYVKKIKKNDGEMYVSALICLLMSDINFSVFKNVKF